MKTGVCNLQPESNTKSPIQSHKRSTSDIHERSNSRKSIGRQKNSMTKNKPHSNIITTPSNSSAMKNL